MERILLWLAVFYVVSINTKVNLHAEALNGYNSDSTRQWGSPNVQCDASYTNCGNTQYDNANSQNGNYGLNQRVTSSGNKRNAQVPVAQRTDGDYRRPQSQDGSGDAYQQSGGRVQPVQQRLPAQVSPGLPPRNNVLPLSNRPQPAARPVNPAAGRPANSAAGRPANPATAAPLPLALAGKSEGQLATTFMAEIGKEFVAGNFVISPFGIWTIAVIVYGLAGGRTATELANLLGAQGDVSAMENAYAAAYEAIQKNTREVESKTLNMVAKVEETPLKPAFVGRLTNVFNAEIFPVNLYNPQAAATTINNWASTSTRNRINNISAPDDFKGLSLLLGSASFFKGRWRFPFNESGTFSDEFKDESDTLIGNVAMMRSREMYKYGYSSTFDSQVIELPYGDGETSMIVFLPRRKVSLQDVLNRMKGLSLAEIVPNEMAEEEVDLSFPRFTINTRVTLNKIFVALNAGTMLNHGAELPGLSDQNFISRISHTAEIETSEQGTTASAVTTVEALMNVVPAFVKESMCMLWQGHRNKSLTI